MVVVLGAFLWRRDGDLREFFFSPKRESFSTSSPFSFSPEEVGLREMLLLEMVMMDEEGLLALLSTHLVLLLNFWTEWSSGAPDKNGERTVDGKR